MISRKRIGILFALPAIVYIVLFYVYPLLYTLATSFTNQTLGQKSSISFIGLGNYGRLLSDDLYVTSWLRSIYYVFGSLLIIWPLSLGLAVALNRNLRLSSFYIVVYFLPTVVSWAVAGFAFKYVFLPYYGMLSGIFDLFGLSSLSDIAWLTNSSYAMPALILFHIWKGVGLYAVMFLAGLQSIPREIPEAATVDGANGLQSFRHVILPLMQPVLLFVIIISTVWTFGDYVPSFVMTAGGPGDATYVNPLFIFQTFFRYHEAAYASAASILFFVFLFVFTVISMYILRSYYEEMKT